MEPSFSTFYRNPKNAFVGLVTGKKLGQCGHLAGVSCTVEKHGRKRQVTLETKYGQVGYCQRCLENGAITCSRCGELIIPGEPVKVYGPKALFSFELPVGGFVVKFPPLYVAGCGRASCLRDSEHWYPDPDGFFGILNAQGKIEREMKPLGLLLNFLSFVQG